MKKLLALLLAAVMVVSLAACGGTTNETTPSTTPSTTPVTESTTEPTETPTEPEVRENKIIYGSATELAGDFTNGTFSNGATDMMVTNLINDYGTLATNREGAYVENPTVVKSIEPTANEDGTKTFTITINEGLVYNNGEPITAKDYAFKVLFLATGAIGELGSRSAAYTQYVGGPEYRKGEADVLSGLHLIDDYTFSLTISSEYVPYYYDEVYASVDPWNMLYWLGSESYDIADDGEGCYFTKDGEKVQLVAADIEASVTAARTAAKGEFVSAGPYSLVNFDNSAKQATLEINPNYAGNFEGQKPSIQTIIIVKAETTTWTDALKTGGFDMYDSIADGSEVNTVLDMIEAGANLKTVEFPRAGYGKIQFVCDITPTQFVEVRQAIAHMLDRTAFVDTFCSGWGSVVNGPFGTDLWQYKENKDDLAEELDTYAYDVDAANQLLNDGGWTLTESGDTWAEGSGLRYKEVTAEQAEYMDECVTLSDGRILMPLIIKWCSSEANPVSDLLASMLANSAEVQAAGMQFVQDTVAFDVLLNYLYRQDTTGSGATEFDTPHYSMFNLATGFTSAVYDYSYEWTDDPEYTMNGFNVNHLYDMGEGGLDDLSMKMVYGVEPGDDETYLQLWKDYIVRWNQLLPDLPLYSNTYVTAIPTWLEGYEQNAFWSFQNAILYATIPSAQ